MSDRESKKRQHPELMVVKLLRISELLATHSFVNIDDRTTESSDEYRFGDDKIDESKTRG